MTDKPWYHKGLRFECTRSGNCCRTHGEYAYVYLSEDEIRAASRFLGGSRAEFVETWCEEEDGWILLRADRPECPFLGPDSLCRIHPVRPAQCRAWPFWEENLERETWEGAVKACCPGVGRGRLYTRAEIEELARLAAEQEDA